MSIRREKATAALLGINAFESGDVLSAAQAEGILREMQRCADSPDLASLLQRAADGANALGGGSILADRREAQIVAFAAELCRSRRDAIAAYLLDNPEPRFAPDPRDIP